MNSAAVTSPEPFAFIGSTVSSVFDLLQNTLDSGERELQLVESQETFAHPRGQFEVTRVR